MSESNKSHRSIEEIQKDYQNLCLKAGHVQYQVVTLKKDLEMMNEQLRDLNLEAAAAHADAPKPEDSKND